MILAIALLFAVNWADSPQGYFMTKAEHAAWSKLTTEAETAQFIDKFLVSRGPAFATDVATRAKEADDNLSVAGKRGSQTLRGKIVILLGRPASVTIAPWRGDKSATQATHLNTVRPSTAINLPPNMERTSDLRLRYSTDYKLVYPKRTIVVAVDPVTGDDRILDARAAREVNALLEAAAEASRVTH